MQRYIYIFEARKLFLKFAPNLICPIFLFIYWFDSIFRLFYEIYDIPIKVDLLKIEIYKCCCRIDFLNILGSFLSTKCYH